MANPQPSEDIPIIIKRDKGEFRLKVIQTTISALSFLATVAGGIFLVLNYWNAQERLITDRFSKAVEQLGNEDEPVRIGGIFALERIANDSNKDYWTIMEVLTSYIREKSPLPETGQITEPIDIDIQAALTVIGRRKGLEDGNKRINLTYTNLSKADLIGANLTKANLIGSNLIESKLTEANLADADIQRATLIRANLEEANLTDATLTKTNLTQANLENAKLIDGRLSQTKFLNANLLEADLTNANLLQADFTGAELKKVNFTEANFSQTILQNADIWCADFRTAKNLTINQIKLAKNWQEAIYDPNIQQELGLQLESKENDCS